MDAFTFETDGLVGDSWKNWWDRRPWSEAELTSTPRRRWKLLVGLLLPA
jgi:hypothetical protein